MRLLVFTTQFPPDVGGVETMSWQLSKQFHAKGVAVTVLAPDLAGASEFDKTHNVPVERFSLGASDTIIAKSRQKRDLVRMLRRTIKDFQPDGMLCTEWDPCAYLAGLASRRVPYFLIAHGMELMQLPSRFPARQSKALLRRRTLKNAHRIFAVSKFTREVVIALGVPEERVSVIPNGVESCTEPGTTSKGTNGSKKILLTVSRLVPRKGHDAVLRAMPQILEEMPNVLYRIVGTGPEYDRLVSLSRALQVQSSIEFCGEVSDGERDRLLTGCDIFLLPTRQTPTDFEGLGIAVLEAMQKGKPVIVTRAGGVPELVDEGRTGVVVEPESHDALAQATLDLLKNPARAREMGENAKLVVEERYRWETIAGRYLAEMESSLSTI
jgi:phosphatidylinositol alpha-1,6-mannosyltransferase